MGKFTYVSLFSGIGGFDKPLNDLGGECKMASEIDTHASKGYEALYNHKPEGDVTKIGEKEVPEHDLLVGGFPCLKGEERVFTTEGLKEIKDIQLGDKVLTHKGNYKKVERKVVNPFDGEYHTFKTQYHPEEWGCTYNHKLLGVKVDKSCWRNPAGNCIETCSRQVVTKREKSADGDKVYEWESACEKPYLGYKREWIEARDLNEGDYLAVPINRRTDGLDMVRDKYSTLPLESELFWEVVGLWVADGSLYKQGRRSNNVRWSINKEENEVKDKVEELAKRLGVTPTYYDGEGSFVLSIVSKELTMFLSEYYNQKKEKQLPEYCEMLPDKYQLSLIKGYWEGDGNYSDTGKASVFGIVSTSLPLLNQVQRILYRYGMVTGIHLIYQGGKQEILGREVNAKDAYRLGITGRNAELFSQLVVKMDITEYNTKSNTAVWIDEEYIYVKIQSKKVSKESFDVYNLTVEDDHSYGTVGLGIYKNCQSFSYSGLRKGFADTRGTLFFEIERIAREKQPKVLFLENVKGLVSHDEGKTLEVMITKLNEIGYRVDYEVLNSKYFGVPQNRERIFIIAVREDLVAQRGWVIRGNTVGPQSKRFLLARNRHLKTFNFPFPKGIGTTKVIKDIMEDDVDEKYYMTKESALKLIEELKEKGSKESKKEQPQRKRRSLFSRKRDEHIDMVGKLNETGYEQTNRVYDENGIAPTITTQEVCYIVGEDTGIKSVGRVHKGMSGVVYATEGVSPTITTNGECLIAEEEVIEGGVKEVQEEEEKGIYIRRLTPREYLRLQAFPEGTYEKLREAGISETQIYKQAGNAVTLTVIEAIMRVILDEGYLD